MKYPHIRQHDEKDCGAACLSMICEYYGLKLRIAKCRELIKVDNYGANIYGIITGANQVGFEADALEGTKEELLDGVEKNELKFPFIARIINDEMFEHFVVVYYIKDDKVCIGDPGQTQIITISAQKFFSQWQGQVIVFSPTSKFEKADHRKGSLKRYVNLITKQKRILIFVFLSSLLIAGISIFSATIFEYIIDDAIKVGDVSGEITQHEHDHDQLEDSEQSNLKIESFIDKIEGKLSAVFSNLQTVCISVIILYLIRAFLQVLRGYLLAIMAKNVDVPLSLGYYNHMLDLPPSFFGTRKTGELMSRFSDASNIREAISNATLTIMLDTIMAILTGIYLLTISVKLFVITLIIMAIYAVIMFTFRKPIKVINQNIMEGNAQVTAYIKESADGIETVKAYSYENVAKDKTENLFLRLVNQIVHGSIVYNLQNVIVSTVEAVGLVLLLWAGAYLCIEEIITIGTLITFYYLLDYFLDPVKNLIGLQPTFQTAIVAMERLNDVLDVETENNENNPITSLSGDIIVDRVSFRYGNRELVLNEVSLQIKKGQKIALVGESGCGKTTLVKLLMRFYNPETGKIAIAGNELAKVSPSSIRNRIAYVSQEIFLFSDTIYNNLAMGNEKIKEEDIEYVCNICLGSEFIDNLPFGYDTMLEENGNNLSGGQKQRLAIARALLRKPDILIFDEATSNLDVITEDSIQQILNNISSETTIIIIAHRLRTIKSCDCIYVMKNGEIIESGTHEELLKMKGQYSEYWLRQQK